LSTKFNNNSVLALLENAEEEEKEEDPTTDSVILDFIKETESSEPMSKNTYFLDGSGHFISLPSLGNSSTKGASPISRIFEEWLESEIYSHTTSDTVPILENISHSAKDIMCMVRARADRVLNGLSSVFINIRVGHISTYDDANSTLCLDDMAEFFQQFSLFVEVLIRVRPIEAATSNTEVLLAVENATVNPTKPCIIREAFCNSEDTL